MRDAAIFPSIKEEFENDDCFKSSLLRDSEPKQLLDSARYIMNGIDVSSYYKFSYAFLPPYSPDDRENIVNLDFNFKYGTTSTNESMLSLVRMEQVKQLCFPKWLTILHKQILKI